MLLGVYFTGAGIWAILAGHSTSLPLFLLFQAGYLCTSCLSLVQAAWWKKHLDAGALVA